MITLVKDADFFLIQALEVAILVTDLDGRYAFM